MVVVASVVLPSASVTVTFPAARARVYVAVPLAPGLATTLPEPARTASALAFWLAQTMGAGQETAFSVTIVQPAVPVRLPVAAGGVGGFGVVEPPPPPPQAARAAMAPPPMTRRAMRMIVLRREAPPKAAPDWSFFMSVPRPRRGQYD